ncbi:hypothetical protein TIFTF001_028646 [Ficus carica]|uniref:Uncharacterized protein n=1 Tax=Ficus carica TaxID=3494 RepID=A0AA88J1E8_FICCA|nr:hypothetical protein TIFTF001_028646 [Ficus carica]
MVSKLMAGLDTRQWSVAGRYSLFQSWAPAAPSPTHAWQARPLPARVFFHAHVTAHPSSVWGPCISWCQRFSIPSALRVRMGPIYRLLFLSAIPHDRGYATPARNSSCQPKPVIPAPDHSKARVTFGQNPQPSPRAILCSPGHQTPSSRFTASNLRLDSMIRGPKLKPVNHGPCIQPP